MMQKQRTIEGPMKIIKEGPQALDLDPLTY